MSKIDDSAWVWAAYVTGAILVLARLARTAIALTPMRARCLLTLHVLRKR